MGSAVTPADLAALPDYMRESVTTALNNGQPYGKLRNGRIMELGKNDSLIAVGTLVAVTPEAGKLRL